MNDEIRRPEPEIIPPERQDGSSPDPRWSRNRARKDDMRVFMWSSGPEGARFHYGRPGPLGLFFVILGLAALSALGFLVFLGLAAIAIPLIGALIFGAIIAGVIRRL
jgi:hypothetical protein